MRNGLYVEGLSNMDRLLAAVQAVEARGAAEASWLLVQGDPGFGKSRAMLKLAMLKKAALVRVKAATTPRWLLCDLADELGVARHHRTQELEEAIITELMQRPRMLIIDEGDSAARKTDVLETLRDITDTAEVVLVFSAMKGAGAIMRRHQHIYDRIHDTVTFGPATRHDVVQMCAQLTDVEIAPCLADRIHETSGGKLRLVRNAIARVEAFGKRQRGKVTADLWGTRPLLNDGVSLQREAGND